MFQQLKRKRLCQHAGLVGQEITTIVTRIFIRRAINGKKKMSPSGPTSVCVLQKKQLEYLSVAEH